MFHCVFPRLIFFLYTISKPDLHGNPTVDLSSESEINGNIVLSTAPLDKKLDLNDEGHKKIITLPSISYDKASIIANSKIVAHGEGLKSPELSPKKDLD